MSIANDLWQDNLDLVQACLDHPFVRGIGDGSLPWAQFAYYVGQDAFFLESFARAYSIAAAKAPNWSCYLTLHGLAEGVVAERGMHEGYAAAAGVDLQTIVSGTATRRYTDFLLATAWSHDVGLTAVAMSPCMHVYSYLGRTLAQRGVIEHDYANWIRTYSDPAMEVLAQQLDTLVETTTSSPEMIKATYRYAMECERDFFQAAWEWRPKEQQAV